MSALPQVFVSPLHSTGASREHSTASFSQSGPTVDQGSSQRPSYPGQGRRLSELRVHVTELPKQQTEVDKVEVNNCHLKSPMPKATRPERGTNNIQTHSSVTPKSLLQGT